MIHEIETKEIKCDGSCNECAGDVMPVIVFGAFCPDGMSFNYCETAREEDRRRGFRVEIMSEYAHNAAHLAQSCPIPCTASDWKPGGKCDVNGCYHE